MILIPESGCAVVKSQGHLGNAGLRMMPVSGRRTLLPKPDINVWVTTTMFPSPSITEKFVVEDGACEVSPRVSSRVWYASKSEPAIAR